MRKDPACLVAIGNVHRVFVVLAGPVCCSITNRSEEQSDLVRMSKLGQ